MISTPGVRQSSIRFHYDLGAVFYRLLWGEHIHHGLWHADETPRAAQRQLIEWLAQAADIPRGAKLLDVGCGVGGSSMHLARHLGCQVTGLTLSPVQRAWAATVARLRGLRRQVRFLRDDAEKISFPPGSFDVVWSVECTEHLFDKAAFFRKAATWLRPGGRMAICAWLAGPRAGDPEGAELTRRVCDAFLCPSFGSADDYQQWMTAAGLHVQRVEDLTDRVARTWEICQRRVERSGVRWLAALAGREMRSFVENFSTLLEAYRTRAMEYGAFIAVAPREIRTFSEGKASPHCVRVEHSETLAGGA